MPDPIPLIATPKALAALLDTLRGQPAVAVDTESNSLYAYRERICLIQLSIPAADFIVDPLADLELGPLGALFADPAVQKVFHAAEQDVGGLRRDFGWSVVNLFDTMHAARILGWPRLGLASVLQDVFGVHTDKRYQRYDWGRRPLSPEALNYACLDTHYLLPLRDRQTEALRRTGRDRQAAQVFAQLAQTMPGTPAFGPAAFWRIKGVYDLEGQERAVLWELYIWRDQVACERDRPPFKVVGDAALLALARARPHTLDGLARIRGLPQHIIRRHGRAILNAIARGESGPPPEPR